MLGAITFNRQQFITNSCECSSRQRSSSLLPFRWRGEAGRELVRGFMLRGREEQPLHLPPASGISEVLVFVMAPTLSRLPAVP